MSSQNLGCDASPLVEEVPKLLSQMAHWMPFYVDMIHRLIETRPSVFDLSVSGSPSATPGPAI